MKNKIILLLHDQISFSISSLKDIKSSDLIVLIEYRKYFEALNHHPKKIAFIISSLRHFAEELKSIGHQVLLIKIDDQSSDDSLSSLVEKKINIHHFNQMVITEPAEYDLLQEVIGLKKELDLSINILEDDRFLCSKKEFTAWTKEKKSLRLEFFYRMMREKYQILMSNGKPEGGLWNYDIENREPPKGLIKSPPRLSHRKDLITNECIDLVKRMFSKNFGSLDSFFFAVTQQQALKEAAHFITKILPLFGQYQDIMIEGEAYLYHSLLSCYLNIGLLLPLEVCLMAQEAYYDGKAPLNAVEGFIRQILGWREYIRGVYWLNMPSYRASNYLEASNQLPSLFWGAPTKMNCLKEVVHQTKEHAYSHHIQRLMITGNFALLTRIDPEQVHRWYLEVYADAFEWVELPNTLGMALHADGGFMASKPYAASANYINKMSNFCKNCSYKHNQLTTKDACPFNAFYWNFLYKNQDKLEKNPRMRYPYLTWNKFSEEKKSAIIEKSDELFLLLSENKL